MPAVGLSIKYVLHPVSFESFTINSLQSDFISAIIKIFQRFSGLTPINCGIPN